MSRNEMHSFASTPAASIPRSKFSMPCNVKFTGNTGKLIPFYVCEVLPGDTFQVNTSIVCRLQTLIHPIFDNIYLDTYYFYVPNRLVWDNWKHFCGEPDRAWTPSQEWTIPQIKRPMTFQNNNDYYLFFKDTIIDYMGIGLNPVREAEGSIVVSSFNALPVRAYNKIFDDWFRDENLCDPINLYTGDVDTDGYSTTEKIQSPLTGGVPYTAAKLHDYFTSALPQAQRGNPVELTFGKNVPVGSFEETHSLSQHGMHLVKGDGTLPSYMGNDTISGTQAYRRYAPDQIGSDVYALRPDNLYVPSGQSLGININDLRMAFQVQKFMERSARGGARYIELLKSMFGVTSPDARLQRAEYLGGHRVPINIHQIVNTTETVDSPLGNTGAMSVTSDVHEDFIHSFVEHGFVIGICCVRYKHTYPQGFDRFWTRKTKFDYYWPVFANIGEQPIRNKEIYMPNSSDLTTDPDIADKVFGYNEAWADYRYKPNRVMGEMRPGVPNTLASWHLADYYNTQPILSESWIKEDSMPVDRAIAVQSSVADQFLFDILIENNATRPMPLYSIPGLVDHF